MSERLGAGSGGSGENRAQSVVAMPAAGGKMLTDLLEAAPLKARNDV